MRRPFIEMDKNGVWLVFYQITCYTVKRWNSIKAGVPANIHGEFETFLT